MNNILDPKLIHSNFPGKISAEESAYREAVGKLIEKVDILSTVLSFLESDITMTAYFTKGQELYFVMMNDRHLMHRHSCRCDEEKNIDTFSSAMDICQTVFEKNFLANHVNLQKHLHALEVLYLEVLSTHEAL